MVGTVSSTQAKTCFGALVESIANGEGDVIVENRGSGQAVIVSVSRYELLEKLETDNPRRMEAETLRKLRIEIQAQNQDMTEASQMKLPTGPRETS